MTAAMMTAIKYGAHQPLKSRPAIQVYETMKGLEYVYNEIASDPNIKETLAFLSLDSVPKELDKAAYDLFAKLFEDKKASGREIISIDKGKDHYYLEKTRKLGNYESRVSKGKLFASDTIVYGTKVAMFSFKNQFAIIIDSREISQSIRALFELAWGLK